MQTLLAQSEQYLHETLGVSPAPVRWAGSRRVPIFLQERYAFYEVQLIGTPCLLMIDKGEGEETPATVRKHLEQVQAKWANAEGPVVYVCPRVTAYNRKRLIEQRVPFIVPGTQMYLPMLGTDLREHFKQASVKRATFSPSTQAVLIHVLLKDLKEPTPSDLAARLGYSAMTVSRAFDEIEAAGLAENRVQGRNRRLGFKEPKRELWARAQPFLQNPVRSRFFIRTRRKGFPGPRAGMSALAHYSMLAEPEAATVALGREAWATLRQADDVEELPVPESDAMTIEVWTYDPVLSAGTGHVDRLSLYLSLRETVDERVQAALEAMLKDMPW